MMTDKQTDETNRQDNKGPTGHPSTNSHISWWNGQGGYLCISIGLKITKLVEDIEYLSSFIILWSAVPEEKWKISLPIRGQGSYLDFLIIGSGAQNTFLIKGYKKSVLVSGETNDSHFTSDGPLQYHHGYHGNQSDR